MWGKIEVTRKDDNLVFEKKINKIQKGNTPIFNHKYIISMVKKSEICSIIYRYIIIEIK